MKKNLKKIMGGLAALVGFLASPGVFDKLTPEIAAAVTTAGALLYIFTGRKPESQ